MHPNMNLLAVASLVVASTAMTLPSFSNETLLDARSEPYPCVKANSCDTQVGIGKGNKIKATEAWIPGHQGTKHAETWAHLWDQVEKECGDTQCGEDDSAPKKVCVSNGYLASAGDGSGGADGDGSICVLAKGSFTSTTKPHLFALAKEVFYRSITQTKLNAFEYEEQALTFINVVTGPAYKGGSGFNLHFNFVNESPADFNCPAILTDIASLGALVPDAAPVFGSIGVVCSFLGL